MYLYLSVIIQPTVLLIPFSFVASLAVVSLHFGLRATLRASRLVKRNCSQRPPPLRPRAAATAASGVTAARVATEATPRLPSILWICLGLEDGRPSMAQLWILLWGAPTNIHQSEPRLRPRQPGVSSIAATTAKLGLDNEPLLPNR